MKFDLMLKVILLLFNHQVLPHEQESNLEDEDGGYTRAGVVEDENNG